MAEAPERWQRPLSGGRGDRRLQSQSQLPVGSSLGLGVGSPTGEEGSVQVQSGHLALPGGMGGSARIASLSLGLGMSRPVRGPKRAQSPDEGVGQ